MQIHYEARGLKLAKSTMRGTNIVGKGGSKLFELCSPIDETIVKGSKLFEPYLQVVENTVKGLKFFKSYYIRTDKFEA
jgi:hypothetical protein